MKLKSIAMLCLAGGLLVGCSRPFAPNKNDADTPPTITVGHVGHDHQIALYIAALEGEAFITQHDVGLRMVKDREVYDLVENGKILARLRLVKVGGGSKMPTALSRGDIQIGLGGVPAVANLADGQTENPVKIICPLQTDGDMLVLAKGNSATTWADFVAQLRAADKPVTIGYKAPMAVAKLIFQRALDHEGIKWATANGDGVKVILHNMKSGKNAIPLLSSKTIDGFVMNQPVVALAEAKDLGHTVADLKDLPPADTWQHHPCCCVCARENLLAKHPAAIKAFLKVIHLGTQFITADTEAAAKRAAEWTKKPLAVEQASVPTIAYSALPTDAWRTGMTTWAAMMADAKLYTGRYKDKSAEAILADLCQFSLCEQAAKELQAK
ncbi:MAG: ABC transporter substrate-binding protein [Phycisphaerales bacterium]|jgi:NitT/TauT family transport system substrate-binding protein|nr:ABC transporter substrate-binding protein [Phycisphaerales bacterium]MBT7171437.1 ABC transporter substrate-binding protein [Phycisphaerales bacterium]